MSNWALQETNKSSRMYDYATKLGSLPTDNYSTLVQQLLEPKTKWLENLWLLALPEYRKIELRLRDFLENTELLNCLWTEKFYIILQSKSGKRFSKSWINKEQITAFINENIDKDKIPEYSIIINQFYPNKYWWSIIINSSWIIIEFADWKQSLVSWWKLPKNMLYQVSKTPFDVSFQYSFSDERLRRLITRTLKYIPHDWDDYLKWYYEFIIWENWEIIFIDARLNDWYIW